MTSQLSFLVDNKSVLEYVYSTNNLTFLNWSYRILLARHIEAAELTRHLEQLKEGTDRLDILNSIYHSRDFELLHVGLYELQNNEFLECAYRGHLGRTADPAGMENYLKHLEGDSVSKRAIVQALASSEEAASSPSLALKRSLIKFVVHYDRLKRKPLDKLLMHSSHFSDTAYIIGLLAKIDINVESLNNRLLQELSTTLQARDRVVTERGAQIANLSQAVDTSPNEVIETAQQISDSCANLGTSLQPQILENQIPYFGVRQQEGRRRVAILTNQLLDWHDGRPRFGGGERYALELARLLKELSFEVTFYQPSFQAPGESEYYGFKVVLLCTADSIGEFHHGLCTNFTELTKEFDHVYYHLPEYASGKVREDGLMTCHGIWFDHNNYPGSIFRTPEWFQQLHSAFSNPRCVVSVDTNSIGVIRSLWPELALKMRFIPNFYDATSYFPRPELHNPKRLLILFPRRSQINRGSRIFGEIVSLISHDVEIVWLGEGDPADTQIVKDVCANDPRASFAAADFDQMPEWYQKADIAVIPTIACEGTSLSCLEALAAGCAVVSTNVGGLPDLVYDGINGLLVDPDARSIAVAINRLVVDRELRMRLQRSASETAHHFELRNWRERWLNVLHEHGWLSDQAIETWKIKHGHRGRLNTSQPDKWLILTRNAIHGGVESLIREEAKGLNAKVVVCGGHDQRDTCPFEYSRADSQEDLERVISEYDIILYHWLPDWSLEVLKRSGKPCIEFVHRTDTAESDKTVPTALVTHSTFLARHIHDTAGRSCRVVDHAISIDRFKPQPQKGKFVGAITSYYDTKGIDVFLLAWAEIKSQFPDYGVRFYGAGDDLPRFRTLAKELGLDVDFRAATREPWEAMKDFACFVVPSRIEGLPVAILEALAMNIPVVASDLPGMVEFNQLAENRGYSHFVHLAKTEEPQDFAAVISKILKGSVAYNSSAYINDYYSPEKHCTDIMSIYRAFCH